jgi:beta-1,2-mannobiose phosphorylase / 1,2-beta-oligomannan phosphorylase
MVQRLLERLLLRPEDLSPSRPDFEVIGVFNPAAIRAGQEVKLLVRVVERPREKRPGFTALPRWEPKGTPVVDWVADQELDIIDCRAVRYKQTGLVRLTFTSHIHLVHCGDGRSVQSMAGESFIPESELEEYGVEDPRLTKIGDRYYFTYVAVSRHGVATALASTADFQSFERHGLIFCPENKDVVLFPEPIKGEYLCLHRPVGSMSFTRPQIWLARSPDLVHWGNPEPLLSGASAWESGKIGSGTPPLKISAGWLVLFHGNHRPNPGEIGSYAAGAMLLDPEHPKKVLKRSKEPILVPSTAYENRGFVPKVVFPTGIVEDGDHLLVYYGAADTCTAMVELDRNEVLALE